MSTGSIINRVTSDVQSVRAFIDGVLIQLVLLLVSLVCYLAYMSRLHVGLTLACLATTPIMPQTAGAKTIHAGEGEVDTIA